MKKIISFMSLVLIVTLLILMLSPEFSFAKSSKKKWLENLPGVPPRLYMGNEVYFHTSRTYPGVNMSSPVVKLIARTDEYIDLVAKGSTTITGIAGIAVSTHTLLNVTSTWAQTVHTQIGTAPRNLIATFDAAADASTGTCVVTGLDARGNEISETLVVWERVSTANYGVKAFSIITQTVWTLTLAPSETSATLTCQLGTGDLMGLMGDVMLTTHFYKGTVDATDETSSFTINATYDTWTHSDIPDGADDYILFYKCDSEFTAR